MLVFILIVLLVAAVFGILGTVLKVAAILVLSALLATAVLVWAAWYFGRRQLRKWERDLREQASRSMPRTRPVHEIRHVENQANPERSGPPDQLGDGSSAASNEQGARGSP